MPEGQIARDLETRFVVRPATRHVPAQTADSRPFWAATREGRIDIQRCAACGRHRFYPRLLCPECWSDEAEWVTSTGTGEIYSFTIVRRAPSPGFRQALPYAVAMVDLDEGVRLVGELIIEDLDAITVGARVSAVFERLDDEITLPHFVLDGAA